MSLSDKEYWEACMAGSAPAVPEPPCSHDRFVNSLLEAGVNIVGDSCHCRAEEEVQVEHHRLFLFRVACFLLAWTALDCFLAVILIAWFYLEAQR